MSEHIKDRDNVTIGKMGNYDAIIVRNDIGHPHLHMVNNNGFDAAIELLNNKYMPESKSFLTDEECREFNRWIRIPNPKLPLDTLHWELALLFWQTITLDEDIEITSKTKIPDYNIIVR